MVSNILGHSVKRQIDDSVEGQVQELRFNTCTHPSNIVNTGIESYRPRGRRNYPQCFYIWHLWSTCLSCLCPKRKGTISNIKDSKKSNYKISLKKFTHRLFNVDTRFTTNVSYLSYALYVTENKQVDEAILIAVRMKKSLNIK